MMDMEIYFWFDYVSKSIIDWVQLQKHFFRYFSQLWELCTQSACRIALLYLRNAFSCYDVAYFLF